MSIRAKLYLKFHEILNSIDVTIDNKTIKDFFQSNFDFYIKEEHLNATSQSFIKIFPILSVYMEIFCNSLGDTLKIAFLPILNLNNKNNPFWEIYNSIQSYFKENNHILFENGQIEQQEFFNEWIPEYFQFINSQNQNVNTMVYTPNYVINFMFRLVDKIITKNEALFLMNELHEWYICDPAMGLFQFEFGWINFLQNKEYSNSSISKTVSERFFGQEIDEMSYLLGYIFTYLKFESIERNHKHTLNVFNQNALSPSFYDNILTSLSNYNHKRPLLVIGNPPYSVSSINKDEWITSLMGTYKVPEPNLTRLYDDYVKFIRYAQWLMEKHQNGVICYICNRKFLDGKIYYGMRKSLLDFFDQIYIADLKGDQRNIKDSEKNTNIFSIQTGVCILLCLKQQNSDDLKNAKNSEIFYRNMAGNADSIHKNMSERINLNIFTPFTPIPPKYLFIPLDIPAQIQSLWFQKMIPITKVFQYSSRALISSRDKFMVNTEKQELLWNIEQLNTRNYVELRKKKRIKKSSDAILENENILASFNLSQMKRKISPINYRPFDTRYVINYTINQRCGSSAILKHLETQHEIKLTPIEEQINNNFLGGNIGINFVQSMQNPPFKHILVTRGLVDSGLFGYSTSKVAPLWINGKFNLSNEFITEFTKIWKQASFAEMVGYIYGFLNCSWYAQNFEPLLLHHYPRVLIINEQALLQKISQIGLLLCQAHLEITVKHNSHNELEYSSKMTNIPPNVLKISDFKLNKINYNYQNHLLICQYSKQKEQLSKMELKMSPLIWEYRIGSIKIVSHWLKGRMSKKMDHSWTNLEWHQLDNLIQICQKSVNYQIELDKTVQNGKNYLKI